MTARKTDAREAVRSARSIVVKIGTTALTTETGMFDGARLAGLVEAIEARMKAGSDVVIVSSGAIAAGLEPLGLSSGRRIWPPNRPPRAWGRWRW